MFVLLGATSWFVRETGGSDLTVLGSVLLARQLVRGEGEGGTDTLASPARCGARMGGAACGRAGFSPGDSR